MIKLCVHSIGNIAIVMVLFTAVCSLLSLVCVATPELPVGETIGQWIWFGKVTLFSAGCVIVVFLLQLLRRDTWKEILFFPNIPVYVSWSLMIMGGIEQSGDYVNCLVFQLPVIFNMYLQVLFLILVRMLDIWQWYCQSVCISI